MKTTFHVFPAGVAGLALVILRVSVVILLVSFPSASTPFFTRQEQALDILAIAVGLGFLTRTVALLAFGSAALTMLSIRASLPLPLVAMMLDAVVLALLGPGAFSIDACLFGRRTLRLPP